MSTPSHYDTIVIGAGGVGSAAMWQLARRGQRVLGLDRFAPPHGLGSSHGQTRIIRQAYFEHPDYTPLLFEAYRLWQELSEAVGQQLYRETGLLQIGPAEGAVLQGVNLSAERHNLAIEHLSAEEIAERWPVMRVPEGMVGVLEAQAGYLLVEQCVAAHLQAAAQAGATMHTEVEVHGWQAGPPVRVNTTIGEFQADRLVITAGAWARDLLSDLGLGLEVRRKSQFWFQPQAEFIDDYQHIPCFLYELPAGVFYGLPPHDQRGVKLAEHSGGQLVTNPLTVDRWVAAADAAAIDAFQENHLAGLAATYSDHTVCLYTMSPDEHFVVDRHPEHPHVAFAVGLSGHGFKFTSALGRALADLLLEGRTDLPIGFLALR